MAIRNDYLPVHSRFFQRIDASAGEWNNARQMDKAKNPKLQAPPQKTHDLPLEKEGPSYEEEFTLSAGSCCDDGTDGKQ